MKRLSLVLVAACGRVGFEARDDARVLGDGPAPDLAADVMIDAPLGAWGPPAIVDIGILAVDDPSMTLDQLELYVNCGNQICGTERASTADPWPTAVVLNSLPGPVYSPHLSADGLTLWVANGNISVTTRTARTDTWGAYQSIGISSGFGDDAPCVTNDGLAIVFDAQQGMQGIWISTRPTPASAWGAPAPIPEVMAGLTAAGRPHLTDDRLTLYFEGPGVGGDDIFFAHRALATDRFDPPQRMTDVSSATFDDEDPWISADQRTLLWSSARDSNYKIWGATR